MRGFGVERGECAIFCRRVLKLSFGGLQGADNAPGRASEATVTILAPKYCKSGASGFSSGYLRVFRAFSVRKNENIGLLEGKHPRFCLESADVYAQEVRCFWPIVVLFFILFSLSVGVFCGKTVRISGCRTVIYVFDLLSMHYRKWKIEPFFALEGMLHAVRIFEGFRLVFHLFCIVFQP